VKCSEGLSNRVSNIIRIYIYIYIYILGRIKFSAYMAVSFITFFDVLLLPFFIIVYVVVCFVWLCLILYIIYFYCYV